MLHFPHHAKGFQLSHSIVAVGFCLHKQLAVLTLPPAFVLVATAPSPALEASVSSINSRLKLGKASILEQWSAAP